MIVEGFVCSRLLVRLFSSNAMANPMIVIISAVVFRYHGIVMIWVVIGGMLWEIKKPAMMLPRANRLMGLIRSGLFSLIMIEGGNRGLVIKTK